MSIQSVRLTASGQVGSSAAGRILEWMNVETGGSVTAWNGTGAWTTAYTKAEPKGVWSAGFYSGLDASFNSGIYLEVSGAVVVGYK